MSKKSLSIIFGFLVLFNLTSCLSLPSSGDRIQKLVKEGKQDEVKQMFQSKNDINETDSQGNTVLHTAALINDTDLIAFLLYKGANADLKNYSGDTPLHVALKNNNKEAALELSKVKSNIFSRDGNGKTALKIALEKGEMFYPVVINEKTANILDERNRNLVHYVVESENIPALNYCIKNKIPLSQADKDGITPLKIAYQKNTPVGIEMASLLLYAGCIPERKDYSYFEDAIKIRNPNLRFDDGQTPLHFAAIYGHTAIADYLLKTGASTKAKDVLGSSPLHEAVRYGNIGVVKLLLINGADPNSQDSLGKTPLLIISPKEKRSEIYKTLLKAGSNPNAKDMYGDTVLHLASMTGMENEILEILYKSGCDINDRNKKGIIPMSLAVDKMLTNQVAFYAQNGGDIHAEDNMGNTPLSRVLENQNAESLNLLKIMVTTKNINSRDSYGNTALHIAINKGANIEKIKYLISISTDIDARNRNGDTPLFIAAKKNNSQAGEILLAKNADVFSTNNENFSPLRIALSGGNESSKWILTSAVIKKTDGIGNTPLHYACEWKLDNAVQTLIEKGANINAKNTNGETPLFSAIKTDNTSTINLLLSKGAKIDSRDYLGNGVLHACIRYDSKKSAFTLIKNGADLNIKNLAGKTPLAQAAHSGRSEMVNLLLESNADINATDATGKTVLIDAIQGNNVQVVSQLLSRGASVHIQEMYGRNAYHEAALTGNVELIKMIRKAGGNPLSRDAQGVTPFSLVLSQNTDVIKAVLGNDIHLMDSDSNTPLHIAIKNGASSNVIDLLIDMGYPVDMRNSDGVTALSYAVENNMNEQVRSLLQNNADPFILINATDSPLSIAFNKNTEILDSFVEIIGNETDYQGEGILHYAAKMADENTVKRLVSKGLDKSVRNVSGETASQVAERWKRSEIANLLK